MRTNIKSFSLSVVAIACFVGVFGGATIHAYAQVGNAPSVGNAGLQNPDKLLLPGDSSGRDSDLKDTKSDKTPAAVKAMIKKMDNGGDIVTLGDINEARQAIARMDVLIELEKKVRELEGIRNDKKEDAKKELAAAIPASVLKPPAPSTMPVMPVVTQPPQTVKATVPAVVVPPVEPEKYEVIRITGRQGLYQAKLKRGTSGTRNVLVGDKLSDGQVVQAIAPTEVLLIKDGVTQTLRLGGVATVFGGEP